MAIEVKVKHDKDLGAVRFTFQFGRHEFRSVTAMAGIIKAFVPASAREYDAVTHEWTILEPFWLGLKALLEQGRFDIVEEKILNPEDFFYNQGTTSEVVRSKEDLANELLAMLGITAQELADSNKAKKAYRKKALELHPDRNPANAERMSELNSTWTAYNNFGSTN